MSGMVRCTKEARRSCGLGDICGENAAVPEGSSCAEYIAAIEAQKQTPDPTPDVLMFIGRFSTDGWGTRWEVVEAFTQGGCYWFAHILVARFDREYCAEIVTDYTQNHFAAMIGGRVFDITGDVTDKGEWEPWATCDDEALRKRITEQCIMF